MSILNFTCNLTSRSIKEGQNIVFIPFSQEFFVESVASPGDNPFEQVIPTTKHFHSVNPGNYEALLIEGTVGKEYPFVSFKGIHRKNIWNFMTSFALKAIPSVDDDNLTHQLKQYSNTLEEYCKQTDINRSTHYSWVAMMAIIPDLVLKFGQKAVFEACVDNLAYHFIDNLYFGIPFVAIPRSKLDYSFDERQTCVMKTSSFAKSTIEAIKNKRIKIFPTDKIENLEEFIENCIQRYCNISIQSLKNKYSKDKVFVFEKLNNEDKEELQALTQHYLAIFKLLSNTMAANFTCDNTPHHLLDIRLALIENEGIDTFIHFIEALFMAAHLEKFNIYTPPMVIVDIGEYNQERSDIHMELLKSLT